MILSEDFGVGHYHIRGYTARSVIINSTTYENSLIVSPFTLIANWPPRTLSELSAAHWEALVDIRPQIVLLGTGEKLTFPLPNQLSPLYTHKIAIECMDTGAACRTYILLMSEGRRVAAALLI